MVPSGYTVVALRCPRATLWWEPGKHSFLLGKELIGQWPRVESPWDFGGLVFLTSSEGGVNDLLMKSVGGSKFGGVARLSVHKEDCWENTESLRTVRLSSGRGGTACKSTKLPSVEILATVAALRAGSQWHCD
jgi:hypothetical protein